VETRRQFLAEYASGDWTMTDLCCAYGISRPTGYALWKRYHVEGDAGRQDRSRAPRRHPNQTAAEIEAAVLQLRRQHPRRGPRTLRRILQREEPEGAWPTASTVGGMLDREGLTRHRPKRRKTEPYTRPFASVQEPNDSWCADFKGWFRTGDGERIDPLTITDSCSRYLLRCQAVAKTDTERTKAIFEAAFREYGMPRVIRTDNGAPFASCAIAGFIAVGGVVDEVGHRAGADRAGASRTERTARERMHRTLKEATASPPAANRRAQQACIRRVPARVQRGASASGTGHADTECGVPEFAASVSGAAAGAGIRNRYASAHGSQTWLVFLAQARDLSQRSAVERARGLAAAGRSLHFMSVPLARFDSRRMQIERLRPQDRDVET
jgi:transposase